MALQETFAEKLGNACDTLIIRYFNQLGAEATENVLKLASFIMEKKYWYSRKLFMDVPL